MDLDGGFRLITTGTPIENHLGELWNLFRFINPGLLGSLKSFSEKFAAPIENNHDRAARRRLKKLVQPFILRRTKSQVLDELPQRTDILIPVALSDDERSFYEALRHKALVFSQFTGHLKIIRDYVEGQSIAYQYLDGHTSETAVTGLLRLVQELTDFHDRRS